MRPRPRAAANIRAMKNITILALALWAMAQAANAQVPVPVIRPDATLTFTLPFGAPSGGPARPSATSPKETGVPASVRKSFAPSSGAPKCFDAPQTPAGAESWACGINEGAERTPSFAVFGDSHALRMLGVLDASARQARRSGIFTGLSGCAPLQGVYMTTRGEQAQQDCHFLNSRYFAHVRNSGIKDIIVIAKWSYYTNVLAGTHYLNAMGLSKNEPASVENSRRALTAGLQRTIQAFKSYGARVYLVEQVPQQIIPPVQIYEKAWSDPQTVDQQIQKLSVTRASHLELQAAAAAAINKYRNDPSVSIVKMEPIFCKGSVCPVGTPTESYYFDNSHLSAAGAALLEPVFTKVLKERLP